MSKKRKEKKKQQIWDMGETLWTSVSIDYNKNVKLARNLKFLLTTPFSEQRKPQGEKQQWEAHI